MLELNLQCNSVKNEVCRLLLNKTEPLLNGVWSFVKGLRAWACLFCFTRVLRLHSFFPGGLGHKVLPRSLRLISEQI